MQTGQPSIILEKKTQKSSRKSLFQHHAPLIFVWVCKLAGPSLTPVTLSSVRSHPIMHRDTLLTVRLNDLHPRSLTLIIIMDLPKSRGHAGPEINWRTPILWNDYDPLNSSERDTRHHRRWTEERWSRFKYIHLTSMIKVQF